MNEELVVEEPPGDRRIERRVRALVAANLGVDVRQVSLSSTFKELSADKLDVASILVDVETVFGVRIPDEDAQSFVTVGDLVAFLGEYFRRTDLSSLNRIDRPDECFQSKEQ
jgi:acyl carrier protein